MDIVSVHNVSSVALTAVAAVNAQSGVTVKNESTASVVKSTEDKQNRGSTTDNNQSNENELKKGTEELNNFMQSMNTDIKFVLHNKTNTLMIQIVDSKNHKILKECPSSEMLDAVARLRDLRDYIGALVDKKM